MKGGRRIYWPDEEPEDFRIDLEAADGCEYCGREGHEEKSCPSRPVAKSTGNQQLFGRRAS